ncbi:hypothetical protein BB560_005932 [Smittium megazygosporum]|uniref:Uncharacterized protein n=1 Tax=Smittium megazygosporum TaxID=133381 RepID=A0A2T9YQ52_9FUNG|nr:hypothetical protein BB560_005932 [Smittium megazygosporum]
MCIRIGILLSPVVDYSCGSLDNALRTHPPNKTRDWSRHNQHQYTINDKSKISAWIKAHNMRNTGSWMDLQMRHPDIKLGLQDIGKIRM